MGDWLETDAQKFPHGLKGMVEEIHASGFQAGLWLAPFVCEKDSALFRQHPDWLLKVDSKPWCCGSNWSSFYALDIDNPAVLDYLRRVFDRVLNDWGFDLVKLDFLYGAAPFGSARESRAGRMHRAMELLRSWCGQKQILGCGVPVMPAFGLVDYCRVSCDVGLDWDDVWYMRLFHRERVSTKQAHQQHGIPAAAQWPCLWQRPGCVLPPGGKLQADGRAKTHPCHGQCPAGQCVPYLGYAVSLHGCAAGQSTAACAGCLNMQNR